MTLLSMQQLASDYLDDPSNLYFSATQLTLRLNLAAKELQKRLILAGQEYYSLAVYTSTIVSQQAYALPADFLTIVRLSYVTQGTGTTATEQKIYQMTPNQRDLASFTSGAPAYYYLQNNNLMLVPVPDKVYTLRLEYTYFITDMVNPTDEPDAPPQFHEYIALMATRDFMIKDMRPLGNIKTKLHEYEVLLKQAAQNRNDDGPRMVVATDSMDW